MLAWPVLIQISFRQSFGRMLIASQLFELKRHIESAGVIAPSFFHWLSIDRWRPLRSAAGCSRTLPDGGVRRRGRRGWHVIAKCEDGNSGHHDPDGRKPAASGARYDQLASAFLC